MNTLELEYKQSTGEYPKRHVCCYKNLSGEIVIERDSIDDYNEVDIICGFIPIPSKQYVEWLEEELIMARKSLTL